jgi:tetratricopeptide (TPR) repeat protein
MVTPLRGLLVTQDFTYRLSVLRERTKELLVFWQIHSPHFTDHGDSHCEAVEKNLDELIPDEVKSDLNEYELFLLLSSVTLHDVGIMCATENVEENRRIRETHHERSRSYVVENLKDLLDAPERYVIGEICYAHRDIVPLHQVEKSKTIRHAVLGNKDVRVQFLAALLRLSDTFDLCSTRTCEELRSTSKLSEEATFHHALHDRVSGIRFDTNNKTIRLDLNISSESEKPICEKYIRYPAQESLDSVRDCLIRNGITYIDVVANYSITNTITSKLVVPKGEEHPAEKSEQRDREFRGIASKAWKMYRAKKYQDAVKCCDKALRLMESPAVLNLEAHCYVALNNTKEARRIFDRLVVYAIRNKDPFHLTNAGHFYSETLLDYQRSLQLLEKAYQLNADDVLCTLNYAEALICCGRASEGYGLATKIWTRTIDISRGLNASFIRACALFFLQKKDLGMKEIENLTMLFKSAPPLLRQKKEDTWVYNKIRKYIGESSLDSGVKKTLMATIKMLDLKTVSKSAKPKRARLFRN